MTKCDGHRPPLQKTNRECEGAFVSTRGACAPQTDLSWRAAECAGKWWGDVGTDHDLAWRFFGRHFFARCRRDAWRRIQQLPVLDQFFNLQAVERFVLEQRLGDRVEVVAIRNQSLFGGL